MVRYHLEIFHKLHLYRIEKNFGKRQCFYTYLFICSKGGGAVPRVKADGRQSTAKVSCILIMCFVLFLIFRKAVRCNKIFTHGFVLCI